MKTIEQTLASVPGFIIKNITREGTFIMYSVVLIGLSSIAQDYFVFFFIKLIIKNKIK